MGDNNNSADQHNSEAVTEQSSPATGRAKVAYRAPHLALLGSLRSATRGTLNVGNDAGAGMMNAGSDPRIKQDVALLGTHANGLKLYAFRYKAPYRDRNGHGPRVGVMADEVALKYPSAVSRGDDGYLVVDYGQLFG